MRREHDRQVVAFGVVIHAETNHHAADRRFPAERVIVEVFARVKHQLELGTGVGAEHDHLGDTPLVIGFDIEQQVAPRVRIDAKQLAADPGGGLAGDRVE